MVEDEPNEAVWIRSMVFVDASDENILMRVAELRPDAICWDLEDSTPLARKEQARNLFPKLAAAVHDMGVRVMVRINPGKEREDLDATVCPLLHCAQIPKASGARDVETVCDLLGEIERARDLAVGHTFVRPVVETAAGIKWAYEIAAASPRVTYMGGVHGGRMGDLGVSLGYRNTDSGVESYYLRAKVLVDVRTAGVAFPIGGGGGKDKRAAAELARDMGYQGMHASAHFSMDGVKEQLELLHEVFTPPLEDVERWIELIPELEAAQREGVILHPTRYGIFDTTFLTTMYEEVALARRLGMI